MIDVFDKWENFLNPDTLRKRLVSAGVFLVAHEMLIDAIIRHPQEFYSDCWEYGTGWKDSKEFRKKVLALDPKGKEDRFRGSLAWFAKLGALDEDDVEDVSLVTDARNQLAHELSQFIGAEGGPDLDEALPTLVRLVVKIEKWWVLNVEVATDEDLMNKEIELDDISPGKQWLLEIMQKIALGNEVEAWEIYRDLKNQR